MRISDWSSDVCSSDLDQGAPIDLVGKRGGRTPIFRAVENRRNAQFDLLVEAGADIRRTDSMGNSLLHVAAQVNDADRILQLLELGADPSATNHRGDTFQASLFSGSDARLKLGRSPCRESVCHDV